LKSELQLLPTNQPVPPVWGEHAETSPLDVIVFSKDRAAQLDALLRSLRAFFGFPHRLHVVYATSGYEFELGYDRLRRWHRGVHWLTDEGMFGSVTKNLVREIGNGPGRYLMFLVDDLLFTRPFTAVQLMQSLDMDHQILAVSLRLGENITYSYLHDRPIRTPDFNTGYRWAWKEASREYWNYPMSLDGHIYRTADVTRLLSGLSFKSPNTLESAMAAHPFPRNRLVCETNPSVVNIAANRVQADYANRCGTQGADSLNEAFLAGQAIDVRPFTGRLFNACHIEEDLPLIADERDPEPAGWERFERDGRAYLRIDLREIPTFILNCAEDRQKRLMLQEQLSELRMNYEFVHTLRVTPGWVGVALGHTKVLRLSRARPPFLVLEDDCVFNEDFQPVIEVPAEADCLYLSASVFGLEKPGQMSWGKAGGVFWERHDEGFLRVYNMLARHALLYLNAGFHKAVIEAQVEALSNRHFPYMCDIGVAMLQPTHIALLTERSMCRQVNRNTTGGCLAEILPGNEWKDGKAVESQAEPERPVISGPRLSRMLEARPRRPLGAGLISHQFRFIYFQIGKNASSTLKAELSKPCYGCEPFTLRALDPETLKSYFKFTFLRDPVSRLVSAYQEISFRHQMQDSTLISKPFMKMDDAPERFAAFLAEVEKDMWDTHVLMQSAVLGHVPMDFYGRVESFATDLQTVFDKLGLGQCPGLPRRRSRNGRKSDLGYDRFNIDHRQLPQEQIDRIRALYQEDVDLIQSFCAAPPLFTGVSRPGELGPERSGQLDGAPHALEQNVVLPARGTRYAGTLELRGGARHPFEIPADSPCLASLRELLSGGPTARRGGLYQVPVQQGRSALTFSGADLRFISIDAAAVAIPHHPLTHDTEGHLGGYLRSRHPRAEEFGTQDGDPATYTPELWQWAIDALGVKSVLDVGCGEGHAAAFFRDRGCTVLGVDGSVQAERDSVIPGLHLRHDYSLGPLVPPGAWDLVWSCEFVEHVEERFADNFLASFACASRYLMMTFASPGQPGWHHVNCQPQHYWVERMNRLGFDLDENLTRQARDVARAGHFRERGLVFVRANP